MLFLGLGTNLGNKISNLKKAEEVLSQHFGPVQHRSKTYESPAWGFESENSFFNNVITFRNDLPPIQVLTICKEIEKQMGRKAKKTSGYSSRLIDIDILLYNNQYFKNESLTIPHSLIRERKFVLQPLIDILEEVDKHLLKTYKELLENCSDESIIKEVKT